MKPTDSTEFGTSRDVNGNLSAGQSVPTNVLDKDLNVMAAEQAVQRSLSRFEHAMENLAHRTEITNNNIQHTREMIAMPKKKMLEWEHSLLRWSRDFAKKSKFISQNAVRMMETNPKPYIWGASLVGLLFGVALFTSFDDETDEEFDGELTLDKTRNKQLTGVQESSGTYYF